MPFHTHVFFYMTLNLGFFGLYNIFDDLSGLALWARDEAVSVILPVGLTWEMKSGLSILNSVPKLILYLWYKQYRDVLFEIRLLV